MKQATDALNQLPETAKPSVVSIRKRTAVRDT